MTVVSGPRGKQIAAYCFSSLFAVASLQFERVFFIYSNDENFF